MFAPPPASLAACFPADDPVRYWMEADRTPDGHVGNVQVGVSAGRVLARCGSETLADLPLAEIEEARVDEMFGGSRLVAVASGRTHVLARYSRTLVGEFAALCRVIEDLREGREPVVPDELDTARCARCGSPLPERGGNCPRCVSKRNVLIRLARLLVPYRGRVALLVLCSTLSVLAAMTPPLVYKNITDRVIREGLASELGWWIGLILTAFLAENLFRFLTNWTNAWLGARVVADLRSQLHTKAQRLRLLYHNRHESGQLVGRVMHDTAELQHFLIDGLPYFLVNMLSTATIGIILVSLSWKLALLVFLPVPLLIVGGGLFWKHLHPLFHQRGNRVGALHTILSESLRGVRAVKSLSQEDRRTREFDHANTRLFTVRTSLDRIFAGFFSSMSIAMAAGTTLVWYFGGRAILANPSATEGIQLGTLVAFASYMALFYGPLQWFAAVFNWATHALTSAERVFSVLDQPVEDYDLPGTIRLERIRGEIELDNIRFSYQRGKEVIKGISLRIEPGTMVGLVGRSGAGKSTLINLICRFYDPDSGRLLVDGHDVREVNLSSWRSQIGIVMQDPFLFNASILDNIRYGRPDATFDEVVAAAKKAQAHKFICKMEEAYDSVVGDGGVSLSGGERQRIAIARAILHDPRVLILDEATSAVDSETEKALQLAIAALIEGRTTIAIAHRLATLRNADRLVVLEDGQIVEEGTHEELLAREGGQFARLVALQTEINRLRAEQNLWQE